MILFFYLKRVHLFPYLLIPLLSIVVYFFFTYYEKIYLEYKKNNQLTCVVGERKVEGFKTTPGVDQEKTVELTVNGKIVLTDIVRNVTIIDETN